MISASSRYAAATIVAAVDQDDNDILAIITAEPTDTVIRYRLHQVGGADEVTFLAYRYYGDSTLWWQIANANPEITNWSTLTNGTLIRIPIITGTK